MHQAMLLTVQACIFPPCICAKLTCYSRACVGAGHHQFLYRTILATWNWVCWLPSQVDHFSIVSLICTDPDHYYLFEDVPLTILQRLADLDYRKPLIAMGMVTRRDNPSSHDLFNLSASVRTLSHTRFEWIGTENFDELASATFLLVCFKYDYPHWIYPIACQVVNKLEKAKVIRPYLPLFGSSRASAFLHFLSCKKVMRRNSGLYKYGHGEKSIIWYWEFDVEKRYFHQFRTIDYAAAVEFYEENKLTIWDKKGRKWHRWGRKRHRRQPGRWWGRGRGRDFHGHTTEHEHGGSVRPKLMVKVRMRARMFGMTMAIPNTMTICRTIRSEEGYQDIVHSS